MTDVEKIEKYYGKGIYNKRHLEVFVKKKILTPVQYKNITGEEYTL